MNVVPTVELINTGTELLLGRTLNTHQQWLCRQLSDLGYIVTRQLAVPDRSDAITTALRESLGRADVVISTGGLGPTSDDLTRDRVAGLLGLALREDPAVLRHIEAYFTARRRPMATSTRVQALVPEGAQVLMNGHGLAPGLVFDVPAPPAPTLARASLLVMLPGPPRELHPMFLDQVVPLLRARFPQVADYQCRVLMSAGLGESLVEERIAGPLAALVAQGLEIGYCARVGEVEIRLSARGPQARAQVAESEAIVRGCVGDYIYGMDTDNLASVVIRGLTERGQTLALAESCTGGFVGHRLTNVPGASAVFHASLVTYSNSAKQAQLGVRSETLAAQGAVSEACAREMAEGVRSRCGTDFGLSVTGIAGPSGGSPEKPVGTVFMAVNSAAGTVATKAFNPFDRETFKYVSSQQALDLLRRNLR